MKATVLTSSQIEKEVARLLAEFEELHWAVAWGVGKEIYEPLLSNQEKFVRVVFGVAFCQTDPNLIRALVDVEGAYVVPRYKGGTFHPKIYAFRSGNRAAAIVGSANFTRGGLGRNFEAAVMLEGSIDDPALRDVFGLVRTASSLGKPIKKPFADRYALKCAIAAAMKKPPRDPDIGTDSIHPSTGSFIERSWQEHLHLIRDADPDRVPSSLRVLKKARRFFAAESSFSKLASAERKAIAGVIGETEKGNSGLTDDWGSFGSMSGAGAFANRVGDNDKHLAKAVDAIPRQGPVSRDDYDRFAESFERAFRDSERMGRISTASRLLALKRPDQFLCISGANEKRASEDIGYARTTLSIENYWERVVEPIQASNWYNSPRPSGRMSGEIWDGRAAMLDVCFYDRNFHDLK